VIGASLSAIDAADVRGYNRRQHRHPTRSPRNQFSTSR